jgi:hypothetical protein
VTPGWKIPDFPNGWDTAFGPKLFKILEDWYSYLHQLLAPLGSRLASRNFVKSLLYSQNIHPINKTRRITQRRSGARVTVICTFSRAKTLQHCFFFNVLFHSCRVRGKVFLLCAMTAGLSTKSSVSLSCSCCHGLDFCHAFSNIHKRRDSAIFCNHPSHPPPRSAGIWLLRVKSLVCQSSCAKTRLMT